MSDVVTRLAQLGGAVELRPPAGQPVLRPGHVLPPELVAFYDACGGAVLHVGDECGYDLSSPDEFVPTYVRVGGEDLLAEVAGDIAEHWYVLATGNGGEYTSVKGNNDEQ